MIPEELLLLLGSALDEQAETEPGGQGEGNDSVDQFDEEYLDRLRFFFDDSLLLAALDLVDRDSVIKFYTPWGHAQYRVLGSTSTYSVFLGAPISKLKSPMYCTCPSFAFSVLLTDAQYMCKHLLSVFLARRLGKCIERPVSPNDLAQLLGRPASG